MGALIKEGLTHFLVEVIVRTTAAKRAVLGGLLSTGDDLDKQPLH